MTTESVFQKLHAGSHLAAAVPSSSVNRKRWLGVYPLDPKRPGTKQLLRRLGLASLGSAGPMYRLRMFEVPVDVVEGDVSEETLVNIQDTIAIGDQDLAAKMNAAGVQVQELDVPFKCEYPI